MTLKVKMFTVFRKNLHLDWIVSHWCYMLWLLKNLFFMFLSLDILSTKCKCEGSYKIIYLWLKRFWQNACERSCSLTLTSTVIGVVLSNVFKYIFQLLWYGFLLEGIWILQCIRKNVLRKGLINNGFYYHQK